MILRIRLHLADKQKDDCLVSKLIQYNLYLLNVVVLRLTYPHTG